MLDPHRTVGREAVERVAIEGTGDRLVIGEAADAAVAAHRRGRQRAGEPGRVPHVGRTAAYGGGRRRERQQVQVVIVETGEERAAGGVEAAAVRVAVRSGLGVSILPAGAVESDLRILQPEDGFPELPESKLSIYQADADGNRTLHFLSEYLEHQVGHAILKNSQYSANVVPIRAGRI